MIGGFFNSREEMPMEDFSYTIMKLQSLFHRQLLKGLEGSGLSTGQPKVLAFLNSHEGLADCQGLPAGAGLRNGPAEADGAAGHGRAPCP